MTSYSSKKEDDEKIRSLQEMIATAEETINSARQMLSQIKGVEDVSSRKSFAPSTRIPQGGQIILGVFDGQVMIGENDKQYPVPSNYASKSKLIEGDMLKLTITPEGNFMYKQIGPIERRYVLGVVEKDERGNFIIRTEEKKYKVLLAAATYFKIELGDEVTIIVPRDQPSEWSAIENVVRKVGDFGLPAPKIDRKRFENFKKAIAIEEEEDDQEEDALYSAKPSAVARLEKEMEEERKNLKKNSILDEWTPDLEEIKKEAGKNSGKSASKKDA